QCGYARHSPQYRRGGLSSQTHPIARQLKQDAIFMMNESSGIHERTGVVIIGRNEGARLVACFDSLPTGLAVVVYVDSGSTDGSLVEAQRREFVAISLDMSQPFSAARARNVGWQK